MADSNKLRLRITTPDGATVTKDLESGSLIVGSGEEAGIRVTDAKVTDLHLRLRVKDGELTATDLGSDSGTTLDGGKLGKDAVVKAGQTLTIGGTTIAVESAESEKAAGKSAGKGKRPSTDGNAARDLAADEDVEPVKQSVKGQAKSTAPQKRRSIDTIAASGPDPRLKEYAARFLSEELPESLRPTATAKRLQVALVWGKDQFLDVKDVAVGGSLTAGDSSNATFNIFHNSLKGAVPLVQSSGNGFRILLPEGANPRVRIDGKDQSLSQLISSGKASGLDVPVKGGAFEIGLNDRVNLEFGNLQVIARYTKPLPVTPRGWAERLDINFISTLVILILIAIAFERMIAITDFSGWNQVDDLFKNKDRFAKYIAAAEKKEQKKKEELSGVKEGAKPKDEEGKFGKKEAKQEKAAPSQKGAPIVDKDKREEDRKKVASSGLLAALGKEAGAASDVLGPGGIGTGLNHALGGINGGAAMGDAEGLGGLGARGGGSGGGGTGLGIGGLGSHGSGRGRGGSGEFDLGGKGKGTTQFIPGRTTVMGGLTADEVGRIIRRHWNEIKYCYEKELSKNPNLAGKVGVYFEIGPVGDVTVAQVKETDLHDNNVEECMLANVRRWKFPNPRGGGVVNVNYPFIFQAQQ
jgi:pSer/pThr/pTyr-binding forkhead associated (FHA) protein